MNISTKPPICARSRNAVGGRSSAEELHVQHVDAAGAGHHADQQLAENGGNAEARADRRDDLPGRKKNGDQQRQLQSCGHPLLLGTDKNGCSALMPGFAAETEECAEASRRNLRAQCLLAAWCEWLLPVCAPVRTARRSTASCAASLRMFRSLIADAQAHQQFAELESGDKAVRADFHGFAHFFHRFLRLQVDAERHAQQHSDLGHVGRQFDRSA